MYYMYNNIYVYIYIYIYLLETCRSVKGFRTNTQRSGYSGVDLGKMNILRLNFNSLIIVKQYK